MPVTSKENARDVVRLVVLGTAAFVVAFLYIGVPVALMVGKRFASPVSSLSFGLAVLFVGIFFVLSLLHSTNMAQRRAEAARRVEPTS